jgi:hypothetical protein
LLSVVTFLTVGCTPDGFDNPQVWCQGCSTAYCIKANPLVHAGLASLKKFTGSDMRRPGPLSVHLSRDATCGSEVSYENGHICLGAYERRGETADSHANIAYFTAMMGFAAWTEWRIADDAYGEVGELMRYVAMAATNNCPATEPGKPCDPCRWLSPSTELRFLEALCASEIRPGQVRSALRKIDQRARDDNAPVGRLVLERILYDAAGSKP